MSNISPLATAGRAGRGRSRLDWSHQRGDQGVVTAIDIGGSKVACMIAHLSEDGEGGYDAEIIGVGQQGELARDKNADLDASTRAAIDAAERMAGERIETAYVAAAGRALGYRRIGVDLDIAGGCVTGDDVVDCLAQGAAMAASEDAMALHAMPILYAVDGERAHGNPCGMMGGLLTVEMLGVSVRQSYASNVSALIERCGLRLQDFVAAPYAAGEAVLIEDEKELGVMVIDIGARMTDFALYEEGALVACGGASLGGNHITRDLAQIFGAPIAHAERIKTLHGAALIGAGDESRLIDFPQLGDPGEVTRASRAEISAVITPRLEEIFELALKAAPSSTKGYRGVRRAVLTGGGSLLVGARETAERVLGVKTRLGRPHALAGAPDAATAPQFSVCAGMIQYAARLAARKGARSGLLGGEAVYRDHQLREAGGGDPGNGIFGGVGAWLRANF